MPKNKQEIVFKDQYKPEIIMNRLLNCNRNIKCINDSLKYHGSTDFTLAEIGLILGITRERVRQIEASAIKKLKHPKIRRILREYIMM